MKKYVLFVVLLFIQAQLLFAQTLLGIDVSGNANGTITWSQVKVAGKEYAWAKATEGLTFNDAKFVANMTNGAAANVVMGAYHFARPDNNSALDEANHFLAIASSYIGQGYLPPALDLEDSPSGSVLSTVYTGAALTTWVQTWLDRVYAQTGVRPIVYTTSTYAAYLTSSLNTTNYKLWIAKPDGSPTTPPTGLGIWSTWLFKQYSWTGTVSGISGTGNVDLDVFNGTVTDFNTLIGMASTVCGNDSPCHAQLLPINVGCVNSNCSTVGATPPSPDIPFSGGATCSTVFQSGRYDDDVWFTITPTNTNTVTITAVATTNTSNFDVSLGLYSGSCGALTQVKCGNGAAAGSPEVLTYTPRCGHNVLCTGI
jgi:GH25 family lysozyme M1 (1,4-beta-N-acetylmuramidase)